MANATFDSVSIDVLSGTHLFRATHSALKFSGFTAVYVEGKDEGEEAMGSPLPDLQEQEEVRLTETDPGQHFTQPPPRFTEAALIKLLEEKGIGRPSTYAPTVSTILDRQYVVKEGKTLRPTPLGEVVNGLMMDKFNDIVDPAFTARMEEDLDKVEEGQEYWKDVLARFYSRFEAELQQAEKDLDGERIKVPDEESDEVCDVCGRKMVIKSGRFGRFLACPGYPECTFTKPLVIEMPGKCPKCGSRILKKTSRNGYTYYGCERNRVVSGEPCDFMTWDVPVVENCPVCGQTMFKRSGRGARKPFCINEKCPNFLPEDQRGYPKRKAASAAEGQEGEAKQDATAESAEKKPAAKKTTATKKPAAKKTVAKKSAAKKTAAKKEPAEKKTTTAKKTTAKKTATAETAAKKTTAAKRTRSKTEETE